MKPEPALAAPASRRKLPPRLLEVVILALAAWWVYRNFDKLSAVRLVAPWMIVGAVVLYPVTVWLDGAYTFVLLKCLGRPLPLARCSYLASTATLGNLLGPFRAGTVANALYLKRHVGVEYREFLSMQAIIYLLAFWTNSVLGLILLGIVPVDHSSRSFLIALTAFAGVFVASTTLFFIRKPPIPVRIRMLEDFFAADTGIWSRFRQSSVILPILAISLLNIVARSILMWFCLAAVGSDVGVLPVVIMGVFASLSLFVSVTPGSLGVREAFGAISGLIAGVPVSLVVISSLIERIVTLGAGIVTALALKFSSAPASQEP